MADTMKFVGQAMPKVDSLARLTGLAQYTDDVPLLPRKTVLYGAFLCACAFAIWQARSGNRKERA